MHARLVRANFDFKHIVKQQKLILLTIHLKRNNVAIRVKRQIKLFDVQIEFDLVRTHLNLILLITQTKLKRYFLFGKLSNSN